MTQNSYETPQLFDLRPLAPAPYRVTPYCVKDEKVTAPADKAFFYLFRRFGAPARRDGDTLAYYTLPTSLGGLRLELSIGADFCEFGVRAERDLGRG